MTAANGQTPVESAPVQQGNQRGAPTAQPGASDASDAPLRLLIAGIGASAGGLEAMSELLRHLPDDTGIGFVLVQHLSAAHDSALPQLLGRVTAMKVVEATDGQAVLANHLHVIVPGTDLEIFDGVLRTHQRARAPAANRSIDLFFESLAADAQDCAIGIVLSGTASDGTLGLEAIKSEGGITLAQDASARYDAMPRSAIAAGCVDFVLDPERMAQELLRIARHPQATASPGDPDADAGDAGALDREGTARILRLLGTHAGVDYTLYKASTIQRRIKRRMVLSNHRTAAEYASFLRGNPRELDALHIDTLINVTSFFRNADVFELLANKVLPDLLQQQADEPLRAWVPGCSTGQEAYSIAMAFVEAAERVHSKRRLQIFATDLNEAVLEKARRGFFTPGQVQDLSPERLRRFFIAAEGGYCVSKSLREAVVFARHNLISDPPFARMNLIACRNLLIYFEASLQRRLIPIFHYALRPGGVLMLGTSESVGNHGDLFEPIDKKHKVYLRTRSATPPLHLNTRPRSDANGSKAPPRDVEVDPPEAAPEPPLPVRAELTAEREADRVSVKRFAPPGVLVDQELQILQFRGATGAYLQPAPGRASFDLLKMARDGLTLPLREAIEAARSAAQPVQRRGVPCGTPEQLRSVDIEVVPLINLREPCFLVLFTDSSATDAEVASAPAPKPLPGTEARRIVALERELAEMRDYAQAVQEQQDASNEELQAANEELQSANEEVQSANEELQSLNEELETAKEELESSNEELVTVNEEMVGHIAELNRLNADLVNIQTAALQVIVLIGRDLRLRRFSVQAERHLNLMPGDIGRSLSSLRHPLQLDDLESIVRDVVDKGMPYQREVQGRDNRWFSLHVRPSLTAENQIDGAVLLMVDIDPLKQREQALMTLRQEAEAVLRTARDPLLTLDAELRVIAANPAFFRVFGDDPERTIGRSVFELARGRWSTPRLRQLLDEILPREGAFDDFEVEIALEGIGLRTMLLNARRVGGGIDGPVRVLLGMQDVTALWQAQMAVHESQARYRALVEASAHIVWATDAHGNAAEDSPELRSFAGRIAPWTGIGWLDAVHPDDVADVRRQWQTALESGQPLQTECRLQHASGWRWMTVRAAPVLGPDGAVQEWVGMNVDDTDRVLAEEELRHSERRFRAMVDTLPAAIYTTDAEGLLTHYNPATIEFTGRRPHVGQDRWCASTKLFDADGRPLPLDQSPLALTLRDGVDSAGFEGIVERPDGERRWFRAFPSRLRDAEGRVVGGINMMLDITDRKQAEELLRDSDRRKSEFLALLGHELRNPLAPIRNALALLRRADHSAPATASGGPAALPDAADLHRAIQGSVPMMERQLGQIARLVDDLLDMGRISRGHIELRLQPVELSSVLHHAAEASRAFCEVRGQKLEVSVPERPIRLDADATRLAQIVGNLLNNASKFSEPGGHIVLTARRLDADQVEVSVRDNGRGIATEQLPRLFRMFEQIETPDREKGGGLGIGLALARELAERHGGSLTAHSEGLGAGSEFTLKLPVLGDEAAAPPPTARAGGKLGRPLRILVVDDNRDAADTLTQILQLEGHATRTGYDGQEAIDLAADWQPDVILLDLGLPVVGGLEAARRIRQHPGAVRPYIVALTGWGQSQDRERSSQAGFDAHLVKPVEIDLLLALLGER